MGGTGAVPHCAVLSSFVATMGKVSRAADRGTHLGRTHNSLNKQNKSLLRLTIKTQHEIVQGSEMLKYFNIINSLYFISTVNDFVIVDSRHKHTLLLSRLFKFSRHELLRGRRLSTVPKLLDTRSVPDVAF